MPPQYRQGDVFYLADDNRRFFYPDGVEFCACCVFRAADGDGDADRPGGGPYAAGPTFDPGQAVRAGKRKRIVRIRGGCSMVL